MTIDTKYLIVGGGMTGDAAAKGIREHDADGSITLVGSEPHPPYARPPLSKKLWTGGDEEKIWRGTAETGADLRLGRTIVSVQDGVATDDQGDEYRYEQLLLATGGRPRRLPGAEAEVVYFRTLDDYRRLRAQAEPGTSFVVIGGGFIGSEIAAALAQNDCDVTIVVPDAGDLRAALPARALGVRHGVLPRQGRRGARRRAGRRASRTASCGRSRARSCAPTGSSPGSGSSPQPSSRRRWASPWTTGSSSTSSAAPDENVWAAGRRRGLPASGAGRPSPRRARGPREVPRQGGRREHGRRRAAVRRTCRSSTPTCSTSGTRRSATSTRGSARSRTGSSRTARA